MTAEIEIFRRKSDHYLQPEGSKYIVSKESIEGKSEQEILDKFYKLNKRADMTLYRKFIDKEWDKKLNEWYNSEDYKRRSFSLFYENSIVD